VDAGRHDLLTARPSRSIGQATPTPLILAASDQTE
jgi:hypothetical protein